MVLEIFTKYLLNASALSFELLNVVLLSITAEGTECKYFLKNIRFLILFQVFLRSLILV